MAVTGANGGLLLPRPSTNMSKGSVFLMECRDLRDSGMPLGWFTDRVTVRRMSCTVSAVRAFNLQASKVALAFFSARIWFEAAD